MSKKSNKAVNETVNNATVNNEVPAEVPEEPMKEKFGTKLLNGVKKHGKKIAAGAVMIGVGIAGYALGNHNGSKGKSDDSDDFIDYASLDEVAAADEFVE